MSKKNSILALLFLFILLENLVALETSSDLSTRLKVSNGYLDKNIKSDILAYIMIYYVDMKREASVNRVNKPLLSELASLVSIYKNSPFVQSYSFAEINLMESDSPVAFFNKYK